MKPSVLHFPDAAYLRRIAALHTSPSRGAAYWKDRFPPGDESVSAIASFDDFKALLGFSDLDAQASFERDARTRPVEDFIPASVRGSGRWFWVSQTGGTTGSPKHGCWDEIYWRNVLEFSDEFLDLHGVPRDCNWLFIGPTGPHTTGRLVIAMAERRGGKCFSIDLDPRAVKLFGEEGMSLAYDRYIDHIWDQVRPILASQRIGVMFATSRLLEMLPSHLDPASLRTVDAVVHAGTAMTRDVHRLIREEVFPGKPVVGIYGTSTTGISFQKIAEPEDGYEIVYIPSSPYIVLEVVDDDGRPVAYGEEGHVATYRLTEDYLIPGFWERDRARRIAPYGALAERYPWDWISGIYSPEFAAEGRVEGVY